jgi:hypothetical protein
MVKSILQNRNIDQDDSNSIERNEEAFINIASQ